MDYKYEIMLLLEEVEDEQLLKFLYEMIKNW